MIRWLSLCCVLVVLSANGASAAGVNLGWDDCGASPATLNRAFACNTNAGTNTMIGSYVAPAGIDSANGNEIVIDVQTTGAALPPWWFMKGAGRCRTTAMSMNADFTAGPFACFDYWGSRSGGGAVGGFGFTEPYLSPNRGRVTGVFAIQSSAAGEVAPGLEVYSFKLAISNVRSTGLGSCAGCTEGACLVLSSIRVTQNQHSAYGHKFLGNPAVRNFITWQSGVPDCGASVTPVPRSTWGAIKARYK